LCRSAMDKADRRVFPVGCCWNACSHHDEFCFLMRIELVVPTDGAKLLEQFFTWWMHVLRGLQDLQYIIMCTLICCKRAKSVKGPVRVSTAGTPMPKLKSKRNIMLWHIINQYAQSFLIVRESQLLYLP
jgi:hypothetical protein